MNKKPKNGKNKLSEKEREEFTKQFIIEHLHAVVRIINHCLKRIEGKGKYTFKQSLDQNNPDDEVGKVAM